MDPVRLQATDSERGRTKKGFSRESIRSCRIIFSLWSLLAFLFLLVPTVPRGNAYRIRKLGGSRGRSPSHANFVILSECEESPLVRSNLRINADPSLRSG